MSWLLHYIKIHSVIKYAGIFPPVSSIQEALSLVRRYHIKSEIIGNWLYYYTSLLIGIQLLCIGFWYSYKHGAYVYTGKPKDGEPGEETLDEIKSRLGSKTIVGG
jgi:hypothetical protein